MAGYSSSWARHLGFTFEDFNLLSALSAQEHVGLARNLDGTTGRAAADRARSLLQYVGLADRITFRPDQLYGGHRVAHQPGHYTAGMKVTVTVT